MSSLAEEEQSFFSTLSRQFLRTHRPFRAIVMDRNGQPILWVRKYLHIQLKVARLTTLQIRRPFQFINSRIHVRSSEGEDGKLVGEAQQYVSICSSSHMSRPITQSVGNGIPGGDATTSFNRMLLNFTVLKLIRCRRDQENFSQFARVDSGFFAWDFWLQDRDNRRRPSSLYTAL